MTRPDMTRPGPPSPKPRALRDEKRTPSAYTAFGMRAEAEPIDPGLHVVATPIGNLRDISFRALATLAAAEIRDGFESDPGYLGPVGIERQGIKKIHVIADRTVAAMSDFVCGANEEDFHLTGVNWGRDLPEPNLVADLRNVVAGDPSPDGQGLLSIQRGIEVGHVFFLGTKYSEAMKATYLDETGKPKLMEMGCYGIGITRILGAAVEQRHDERGMIWPAAIAPFAVVICPVGYERFPEVKAAADGLYAALMQAGVDVILDDRGERPGAMFADWELIGVPHRVAVGERSLKEGNVEYQGRQDAQSTAVRLDEVLAVLKGKLSS